MASIYTDEVVKRLIDIDDDALAAAQLALGTRTMRDTVNEALRRAGRHDVTAIERAVAELASIDLDDRGRAWQRG